MKIFIPVIFMFFCLCSLKFASAQLYINGGQFLLDTGAVLNVKGDLTLTSSLGDSGKIIMNGTSSQYLGSNNIAIPNLEINNNQNVTLSAPTRVQGLLTLTNGKLFTGNNDLTLSNNASVSGMTTTRFIETSGTGKVVKELNSNLSSYLVPVGVSSIYRPVYLTTQSSSYSNAKIDVKSYGIVHPNKPVTGIVDYLKNYWTINRTGFSGSLTASGKYTDPTDVTGSKTNLRGYFYDGSSWSSLSGTYNSSSTLVGAPVTGNGGVLYGMNQYIVSNIKLYIQGYYDNGTGQMSSLLYDLGVSPDNTACDSVTVCLWSPSNLNSASPNFSFKTLLHNDGTTNIVLPEAALGNNYYVAVKGRNLVETWSASPIFISNNTMYDFSTSLSKAYGDGINPPMASISPNRYLLYAGDVNQDGAIDLLDMVSAYNDANQFMFGYQNSDCNGDGATDLLDMVQIFNSSNIFLFYARP